MNCSKAILAHLSAGMLYCLFATTGLAAPLPASEEMQAVEELNAAPPTSANDEQTTEPEAEPTEATTEPAAPAEDPVVTALKQHLQEKRYPDWATDLNWRKLHDFYATRDFQPVWRKQQQLQPYAVAFRNTLLAADEEGLNPKEYHADAIRYLWRARRPRSQARLDLLLTDAFLRYSVEVRAGYQYPRAVDHSWYMNPPRVHPASLLQSALQNDELPVLLEELPPRHPEYRRLKQALQQYRALNADWGDWPRIPPLQHSLRVGDIDPAVPTIRKRLIIEGFLQEQPLQNPELFDVDLEQAVKAFQERYGHFTDGVVGRRTRHSLNISLPQRIEQIQQNMERWRWLPSDLGDRYVMVNMAGYKLYLIEDGDISMEMRVIIGKPYKSTPAFRNAIEYLEINPTWNVPPRIAKQDLLPKIQANNNFLKVNRMRVWENWKKNAAELDPTSINWDEVDQEHFPYKLTQDPGPHNSLGSIKFMFPNGWRIYLHDTPNKALFDRKVRTFSSGCIRIERPIRLAEKLIGSPEVWSRHMIRDIINSERTVRVDLPQAIPIYLLYWTAWADENDHVHFRDDVYQRNGKIATGPISDDSNS